MSCDQRGDIGLALQEADHLRIAAGQIAQPRLPVGIRQRARIEHEIGIARNAVFESERLERTATAGPRRAARRAGG